MVCDEVCELAPEADEKFAALYSQAMDRKERLREEAEKAIRIETMKVYADGVMADLKASLQSDTGNQTLPKTESMATLLEDDVRSVLSIQESLISIMEDE